MCASTRMLPNSNNNQTDQDFGLVQFSRSIMSDSLRLRGLQHARLPCPSPNPGAYSNSCASSQWYHPTISSSVIPFSSHLQSFPASGLFPMSQFFASGGDSIGVSASTSVLPMNIQDWFPLGWTGWISLQSKGLSRVFSNTTFLGAPKITAYGDCNLEIKMLAPWQKSYDQPRQHIKKQRCYFANEGPSSQSYGFPVVMYGRESWTTKIAERQRIDAFDHYLHPCFLPGMQERSLRTVQGQATSLRAQVPGCYWALSRGHVAGPYSASI